MCNISADPNQEVEKWKDRLYEEIKKLNPGRIGIYLEEAAKETIKKYNVKFAGVQIVGVIR